MADLRELVDELQSSLALVDLLSKSPSRSGGIMELLILKRDNLKIKIYQEPGHSLPHIHIDYGKISHAASFSIDPPKRLIGQLSTKYDRSIIAWMESNGEKLLALWEALQVGGSTDGLVAALQGDA